MNVWGIHMGAHVGSTPIDEGYIAIGWDGIGDLSKLEASREAFKEKLASAYPNTKAGAIPVQAGVLYRFVHDMQEGDIIIYPSKSDRMVNIGRVTSSHIYNTDDKFEYPNHRKVEWEAHIPRDEFTQAALNEIGSAVTLFSVTRYAHEFLARINEASDITSISGQIESEDDEAATGGISKQAVETTSDYIIRKLKSDLDPYEFEYFVAHILECMGYTARVTQASADGGVDVIAHKDELGFEPPIIKVQCKQITHSSSEPEANQLLGTLGDGEFALFVNLGSYSRPARSLERNRSKLRLIDGEELVSIILENYERLSPKYRTMLPMKQIYVPDL
jgi:restriction system protein